MVFKCIHRIVNVTILFLCCALHFCLQGNPAFAQSPIIVAPQTNAQFTTPTMVEIITQNSQDIRVDGVSALDSPWYSPYYQFNKTYWKATPGSHVITAYNRDGVSTSVNITVVAGGENRVRIKRGEKAFIPLDPVFGALIYVIEYSGYWGRLQNPLGQNLSTGWIYDILEPDAAYVTVPADAPVGNGYRLSFGWGYDPSQPNPYASEATSVLFDVVDGPVDLTATASAYNKVQLAWLDNHTDETGRRIERSEDAGTTWREIALVDPNVTAFEDSKGLNPNVSYRYRVQATLPTTLANYTNVASVATPAYDNSVTGTPYLAKIELYPRVIKSGSVGVGTVTLNKPSATNTTVTLNSNKSTFTLPNPATVSIPAGKLSATFPVQATGTVTDNVFACISAKTGDWTQAVVATAIPQSPSYALEGIQIRPGNKCVSLHWAATSPSLLYKGVYLYRRLSGQSSSLGTQVASVGQSTFIGDADVVLSNGTQYEYRLGIQEWGGNISWWSPWLAATPSQTAPTVQLANFSPTWNGHVKFFLQESVSGAGGDYQLLVDGQPYNGFSIPPPYNVTDASQSDLRPVFSSRVDELTPGNHKIQVVANEGTHAVVTSVVTINVVNNIGGIRGELQDISLQCEYIRFQAKSVTQQTQWHLEIVRSGESMPTLVRTAPSGTDFAFAWDTAGLPFGDYNATLTATTPNQTPTQSTVKRKITVDSKTCNGIILISRIDISPVGNTDPSGNTSNPDGSPFDPSESVGKAMANAFRQRQTGYIAHVLLAEPNKEPDWDALGVSYQGLKDWIAFEASDFYAHSHGTESYTKGADNGPTGRLKFKWGNKTFISNADGYSGGISSARKNKSYVYPHLETGNYAGGQPRSYRFVWIDTCFSAGGYTNSDDIANYGKPVESASQVNHTWADAFGIASDAENCFFGWNGFGRMNSWAKIEGSTNSAWLGLTTYWYDWRLEFIKQMGEGAFVTSPHEGPFPTITVPPIGPILSGGAFGKACNIPAPGNPNPRGKPPVGCRPWDPFSAVIYGNIQF